MEKKADGEEGDEPKYITGNDRETFTLEQLTFYWNQYTNMVKEANKINIYTLMSTSAPILESQEEIMVHIEHKLQEDLLQDEMIDLLNFLRPRLKNFSIYIKTKQVVKEVVNRLYTSTEKYQYLVEKNPKLEEMRRRFNLDVNP
ncbi:hypothetical protein D3C86_1574300 [compost metagenome]